MGFAPYDQKSLVFASVFVIVWLGAAVVTVNALLLGGNISFFQSVCVLGYCIFPLNIASFICLLGGPLLWGVLVPPNRKALAVYPLFLFYTAIGWLILSAA